METKLFRVQNKNLEGCVNALNTRITQAQGTASQALSNYGGIIRVTRKNVTQSGSSDNFWNIVIPRKTGYTRVPTDVSFGGTNSSNMMKYSCVPIKDTDNVRIDCRNLGSTAFSGSIVLTVLYVSDDVVTIND